MSPSSVLSRLPSWSDSGRRAATLHLIRAGFGAIAVFFIVIVSLAITRILASQHAFETATTAHREHSNHAHYMINAARERSFLLFAVLHETDPFSRDEKIQRFHELGAVFSQARQSLMTFELVEEEKALLRQQGLLVAKIRDFQQQAIDLAQQGQITAAEDVVIHQVLPVQDRFVEQLTALIDFQNEEVLIAAKQAREQERQALYILVGGGCVFVLLSFFISRFVFGRTKRMVESLADVSDSLQSSNRELEFQKLTLDRHAIVSMADIKGRIIYVNDMFCEVSLYSREELLGQDHRLLNSGCHPKAFFVAMWQTIASGQVWQGDVCNRKKNGDTYWVATTIVPFLDGAGKPERYVSVRTEITAIKQAETMLREGQARLEQMVAERTGELEESRRLMQSITGAAQDAIVMIDEAACATYWNEAAERLFGYRREAVLGEHLYALIAPEASRDAYRQTFGHFIQAGEGERLGKTTELTARRADGSEIPIEISLSAVRVGGRWHGIGIMRDVSERKRMEELLRAQATTDPLTGIHNRRKLDEMMALEQARCKRYRVPFTLVLFDIDHFKRVNDTFGHPVGDAVLKELAALVAAHVRPSDLFARWGGEEFALLAGNCSLSCVRLLAEKLRHIINSHSFPTVGRVTCSFGVAEFQPDEATEAFLARVDGALYRAKQQGRNRVEYA
jgi:diguanylate cyclase (GGDEF)-like protein/PAS domain S-box-containing protein